MIFVVEDDHGVRELELYALRQSGYQAEGFETPAAFRQALEKTVPDCVLLDVMLPGEDGLSLLRFLRRDARTRRVPVILVTARDAEMDKVKGLDRGAQRGRGLLPDEAVRGDGTAGARACAAAADAGGDALRRHDAGRRDA